MLAWSVGEVLWDIFPDAERFGGAALNFCVNLQRLGDQALLLSAVGADQRGASALAQMKDLSLSTQGISVTRSAATGIANVSFRDDGEPAYDIPRPAAFDYLDEGSIPVQAGDTIAWLYFGTLCQTRQNVEHFVARLAATLSPAHCFYDMNLRPGQWDLGLVQRLSALATILKLNEEEARTLFLLTARSREEFSLEAFCRHWSSTYSIETICVTLGGRGCMVYADGMLHASPGFAVAVVDTVGSGDAFAAAFLHGVHQRWPIARAARFANALGALVASRPGATPEWHVSEVLALMREQVGQEPA